MSCRGRPQLLEITLWKNGTPLSPNKAKSISQYSLPAEQIASNTNTKAIAAYLNRSGGAIWRIFFLHLQNPSKYPIYDQHVHRAMAVVRGLPQREIPTGNAAKVTTYLQEYLPFFSQFAGQPSRRVDRALWAFGKFMKSGYGRLIDSVKA